MKLGIDAREISVNRPGGLRSYAESVVSCLSEHNGSDDITFYLDREVPDGVVPQGAVVRVCPPAQLAVREQLRMPDALTGDGIQLCHFLANTAPLRSRVPFVLTLHDTFCIERSTRDILRCGDLHNKAISLYCKIVPRLAARKARKLVTVSRYSAERIGRTLKRRPGEIAVIPQAMHERYRPVDASGLREELTARLGVSRLGLVLGSIEPRKNTARVIKAFDNAFSRSGSVGLIVTWPSKPGFGDWADMYLDKVPDKILVMSDISNDRLVELYSAVDFFVFASLNEGFGLPLVEAMACGCPAITSNSSCLPDTAGGAALLVDALNEQDIADKMSQMIGDEGARQALSAGGLARAKEFGSGRAAAALLDLYRGCVTS